MTVQIATFSLACAAVLALSPCANAGPNDFFGGSMPPGGTGADRGAPGVGAAASQMPAAGGGDYTDDEKRMQKRYQASLKQAKELVSKGDTMMKRGEARHDDKMLKKGKIFKEIGEKQLAELKANDPTPAAKSK